MCEGERREQESKEAQKGGKRRREEKEGKEGRKGGAHTQHSSETVWTDEASPKQRWQKRIKGLMPDHDDVGQYDVYKRFVDDLIAKPSSKSTAPRIPLKQALTSSLNILQ